MLSTEPISHVLRALYADHRLRYPIGALNWTGDDPCAFAVDSPNFGGFVSSTTATRSSWWKLGQIKASDTIKYRRVSLDDALTARRAIHDYLAGIERAISLDGDFTGIEPLKSFNDARSIDSGDWGTAIVWGRPAQGNQPEVKYRQGGDDYLIVEYGQESFDLNHRCRVTALEKLLHDSSAPDWLKSGLINTVGGCTSITIFYDGMNVDRKCLVSHLQSLEEQLGDLSNTKVPCRRFRLPLTFKSAAQEEAIRRYIQTSRPQAPYLPDNFSFVAKNNALTPEQLKEIYLTGSFMAVIIGFYAGLACGLPVDPRQRISCPKQNPSRVYTPAGSVSWGGSCMAIYPVDR